MAPEAVLSIRVELWEMCSYLAVALVSSHSWASKEVEHICELRPAGKNRNKIRHEKQRDKRMGTMGGGETYWGSRGIEEETNKKEEYGERTRLPGGAMRVERYSVFPVES